MKTWLLMIILMMITMTGAAQTRFTSERTIHLKSLDQQNIDAYLTWKGALTTKDGALTFTAGYGQTLAGGGWLQPKNSWGNTPFASGLAGSQLSGTLLTIGPEYIKAIRDLGWGRNGFNFMFDGKFGKMSLGGAYSGYADLMSLNFSGTTGAFTGRGTLIMQEGVVEQLRTDFAIKF